MDEQRDITPHKGGRNAHLPRGRCTEQERGRIDAVLEDTGLSFSDWVIQQVEQYESNKKGDIQMLRSIDKATKVEKIKEWFIMDFSLEIDDIQAEEIRDACSNGSALWTSEKYIDKTISHSHDIVRANETGVWYTQYETFYSTDEWNEWILSQDG